MRTSAITSVETPNQTLNRQKESKEENKGYVISTDDFSKAIHSVFTDQYKGKHILIVSENAENSMNIMEILKNESYDLGWKTVSILTTEDGQHFVAKHTNGDDTIDITPVEWDGTFSKNFAFLLNNLNIDLVLGAPNFNYTEDILKTILECGKDFMILANGNVLSLKNVFPMIKNNVITLTPSHRDTKMICRVSDSYDAGRYFVKDGHRYVENHEMVFLTNMYWGDMERLKVIYNSMNSRLYQSPDNFCSVLAGDVKNIPGDLKNRDFVVSINALKHIGSDGKLHFIYITRKGEIMENTYEIVGNEYSCENLSKGRFYTKGQKQFAKLIIRLESSKEVSCPLGRSDDKLDTDELFSRFTQGAMIDAYDCCNQIMKMFGGSERGNISDINNCVANMIRLLVCEANIPMRCLINNRNIWTQVETCVRRGKKYFNDFLYGLANLTETARENIISAIDSDDWVESIDTMDDEIFVNILPNLPKKPSVFTKDVRQSVGFDLSHEQKVRNARMFFYLSYCPGDYLYL